MSGRSRRPVAKKARVTTYGGVRYVNIETKDAKGHQRVTSTREKSMYTAVTQPNTKFSTAIDTATRQETQHQSAEPEPPVTQDIAPTSGRKRRRRQRASNSVTNLLTDWNEHQRQHWAEMFIQVTELPPFSEQCCSECSEDATTFLCMQCEGISFCRQCLLQRHSAMPLHSIKIKKDSFYTRTTLAAEGLVIQLNHSSRSQCRRPQRFQRDFTVVHEEGQEVVNISYCGCKTHIASNSRVDQIFRMRWIPATWNAPRTAFTFGFLNRFHLMNLQAKCNLFDFYKATLRIFNNADLVQQPNKYNELSFAVRVWRDLKQLKRSGRIHDPEGVANMSSGDLVPKCPACPDPDTNLEDGWDCVPEDQSYLYEKVYALDACMKLAMKEGSKSKRSNDDPYASSGCGVFTHEKSFREFLTKWGHLPQEPVKSCGSKFHAVSEAKERIAPNTPISKRQVTGVAGVKCARHAIVERVCDLHYGERYMYMDYIVMECLRRTKLKRVAFTYDIWCKYEVNLTQRVLQVFSPEDVAQYLRLKRRGFIPKLHLYDHGASCLTKWSLNYHPGLGRTDGESTERDWASAVLTALQTAEMNPGSRHAALDDHWIDRNFRRIIGLRPLLLTWFDRGIKWSQKHAKALKDLEAQLDPGELAIWKIGRRMWELDPSLPDPYTEPETDNSSRRLREFYKSEEAARNAAAAQAHLPAPAVTVKTFIMEGRTLLRRQFDLCDHVWSRNKLSLQERTHIEKQRISLQRDIRKWCMAQAHHMPYVQQARMDDSFTFDSLIEPESTNRPIRPMPSGSHRNNLEGTREQETDHSSTSLQPGPHTMHASDADVINGSATSASAPAPVNQTARLQKRKRTTASASLQDAPETRARYCVNNIDDVNNAENIQLWLPSDIPCALRQKLCSPAVIAAEMEVLIAEMHDSLVNVRRYRHVYCSLRFAYKGQWSASNASGASTRKRGELASASSRINKNKIAYQRAWDAAQRLHPDGDWSKRYCKLKSADIRGPQPGDDITDLAAAPRPRDQGAGQYEPSWIWRTITDGDEPLEYFRVLWGKTAAHTDRWREELAIVRREMQGTILSFDTQARWWRQRSRRQGNSSTGPNSVNLGTTELHQACGSESMLTLALDAYANRQQYMLRQHSDRFILDWLPHLWAQKMGDTLPARHVFAAAARQAANAAQLLQMQRPVLSRMLPINTHVNKLSTKHIGSACLDAEAADEMWNIGPAPVSAVPGVDDVDEISFLGRDVINSDDDSSSSSIEDSDNEG